MVTTIKASNFFLQYHPQITHINVARIKGNDYQLKRPLIVTQILLVGTLGNVWRTVWRMYILMLECKELNTFEKIMDHLRV